MQPLIAIWRHVSAMWLDAVPLASQASATASESPILRQARKADRNFGYLGLRFSAHRPKLRFKAAMALAE